MDLVKIFARKNGSFLHVKLFFQTLSYDVGQQWDRCFWYWYDHPNSYSYCSFDMDSKGSVKQHKCKPAALVRDLVCPLVGK